MSFKNKKYNIGLLGFGKVLRAFVRHYLENEKKITQDFGFELEFTAVADSKSFLSGKKLNIKEILEQKEKANKFNTASKNPLEGFLPLLKAREIDLLIDGLPGSRIDAGVSYPFLLEAVKNRIHIICANKSPIVFKGDELFHMAEENRVYVGMSATTGGALPIAGIIKNDLINAGVYNVRGVLNGTSNYVLDKIMFEGKTKLEAIQEAIRLGIAEPDYRFDVEGIDTCYKTIILGLILTNKCADLRTIFCQGIMDLGEKEIISNVKQGKVTRLIGNLSIEDGKPIVSVRPEFLDNNDPLFGIYGANKGVTFRTKYMGDLTLTGGASGLVAIAATILKDIIIFHRFYS